MNARRSSVFPLIPPAARRCALGLRPMQMIGPATRPAVVTGAAYDAAQKVPVAQIGDQTPGSSYALFAECPDTAVSVADVRQYGPDADIQTRTFRPAAPPLRAISARSSGAPR